MNIYTYSKNTIDAKILQSVLAFYSCTHSDLLAVGTEAYVYRTENTRLLKIYPDPTRLTDMLKLKCLLDSINRDAFSYALPEIHSVELYQSAVCVIEKYIPGVSMEQALVLQAEASPDKLYTLYLEAANSIKEIQIDIPANIFSIFDTTSIPIKSSDWYSYFHTRITQSVSKHKNDFIKYVSQFDCKYKTLLTMFSDPEYSSPVSLIHGDIFPGNILLSTSGHDLIGIIDFGRYTLFGDPIYDLATACIFFAMYEPERALHRNRLLAKAQTLLPEHEHVWLYRYILGCAFISAPLYQQPNEDLASNGHFCWAMEILNDKVIWDATV